MQADLGDADAAGRLFDQAENLAGPLDILVNNARAVSGDLIADTTDEDFDAIIAVNLKSPFVLIREAARRLRDGERLVNISTLYTVVMGPRMALYAATRPHSSCSAGSLPTSLAVAASPSMLSCRGPRIPNCSERPP